MRKLYKITPFIVSAASFIFAAQFLYHTINNSRASGSLFNFILILSLSVLVMIGLHGKSRTILNRSFEDQPSQILERLSSMSIVISSAMITYFIASQFEVSTIFSASLVCVIFAVLFPKFESEAYSGTVAGMIGAYLCTHWLVPLATAVVTSFVFSMFKPYFRGVGGRGGAIPYVATTLVVRLFFQLKPTDSLPIEQELILPAFVVMLLVTFLTYYLHESKRLSIVKSAMLVSLVFSVLIPSDLYTLTTAMFAGTILGMSNKERIDNYLHLFVVFLVCFVLFIPSFHLLDGIGGKLGLLSLLSYYGSIGLKSIINVVQPSSQGL